MKIQVSDSEFISRYINNGDESAFASLTKKHRSKVYSTIYMIVKDPDVAEDLVQDTFIKAFEVLKAKTYNEEGKFLPWLVRIAHNLAIDTFRRDKRYPTTSFDGNYATFNSLRFSEASIEERQINEETYEHLRKLIEKLPRQQREVLMMRHYEDMSFQEIADATGVSINTALGRMRYALISLRKMMTTTKHQKQYDRNNYSKRNPSVRV